MGHMGRGHWAEESAESRMGCRTRTNAAPALTALRYPRWPRHWHTSAGPAIPPVRFAWCLHLDYHEEHGSPVGGDFYRSQRMIDADMKGL